MTIILVNSGGCCYAELEERNCVTQSQAHWMAVETSLPEEYLGVHAYWSLLLPPQKPPNSESQLPSSLAGASHQEN